MSVPLLFYNPPVLPNFSLKKVLVPKMSLNCVFSVSLAGLVIITFIRAAIAQPCREDLSIELGKDDYELFKNGSLLFRNTTLYPHGSYWQMEDGSYRLCVCTELTCWRKCCPENEVFVNGKCAPSNSSVGNPLNILEFINLNISMSSSSSYPVTGFPCNNVMFFLDDSDPLDEYSIEPDGRMFLPQFPPKAQYANVFSYCIDAFVSENSSELAGIKARLCFPETKAPSYKWPQLVSIPFLLVSIAVLIYVQPRGKPWSKHIKSLLSYLLSLLVSFTTLTTLEFLPGVDFPKVPCNMIAFTIQFSFLANFFWLNAMCVDIWWTFSECKILRSTIQNIPNDMAFVFTSVYAWGCPFVICVFTALVNSYPDKLSFFPHPNYGIEKCFIENKDAEMWFFFYPAGIVLSLNLVLFIVTAVELHNKLRVKGILQHRDSKKHQNSESDRSRFGLYVKLFVLMGAGWIMEVVSRVFEGQLGAEWWYPTDILNTLTGVIIFILYVCDRKTRRVLAQKLCPQVQLFTASTTKTSTKTTNSTTSAAAVAKDRESSVSLKQNDMEFSELGAVSTPSSDGGLSTNASTPSIEEVTALHRNQVNTTPVV